MNDYMINELTNIEWGFIILDMICVTLFAYFYIRAVILIVKSWFNKSEMI